MKQDIITWLKSGANAQEGVQLMKRAGAPSLALRLISSNPSRYKKMMVEWLAPTSSLTVTVTPDCANAEVT